MSERARGNAPKALRTSDVARPRTLGLAALGAGVGVAISALAGGAPPEAPRPIARPHAKVACASCHEPPAASGEAPAPAPSAARAPEAHSAARACTTCHGTGHVSTRPAHRRLAASGELGCATCHTQHRGGQGVTFAGGSVVRWGAGSEVVLTPSARSGVEPAAIPSGTTVPLVSLAACARCHDPSRAADPISACVPAPARARDPDGGAADVARTVSQCFDEHAHTGARETPATGPVCSAQHTATRFTAWEAAREIAATTATYFSTVRTSNGQASTHA